MTAYDQVESLLERCNSCGACQAVCPVYAELGVESEVARGKIRMAGALRQGQLEWTPGIAKRMDLCLQCKRCAANCPGGSEGDTVIRWCRSEVQKRLGVPFLYRAIARWFLPRRWIFSTSLGLGKIGQKFLFRAGPGGQGMLPRIPFGIDMRRVIKPIDARTLMQRLPEVNSVAVPKMKVVYFSGCMANYFYPQVGEALVRVLNHLDVEVVIPKLQHCCGMPVFASGDDGTARIMAEENIKVLSAIEADAIVVTCGSCGLALKEHYAELFPADSAFGRQAKEIGKKIKDISQILVELPFTAGMGKLAGTVTYHDPCHLKNGLRVSAEPRRILQSIPGLKYVENENGHCCGSGGSFSLKHYELSTKITDRCLTALSYTGAATVATGCLACRMQLEDSISQSDVPLEVHHLVEMVDQSYSIEQKLAAEQKNAEQKQSVHQADSDKQSQEEKQGERIGA